MSNFNIIPIIVITALLCLSITFLPSLKKYYLTVFLRYFLFFLLITFSTHLSAFFFFPSQGDKTQFFPLINNFVDKILFILSAVLCIPGAILQFPVYYLSKIIVNGMGLKYYKVETILFYTTPIITSLIFSLYYSLKYKKNLTKRST